jgi:hypothetical protein
MGTQRSDAILTENLVVGPGGAPGCEVAGCPPPVLPIIDT